MPAWTQIVIGAAGLAIAFGILWSKVVLPAARLITDAQAMLPLLKDLPILREIIAEFRTDSGSSLRDVIDRIERQSLEAQAMAQALAVDAEVIRRLAETDRQQLATIVRAGIRAELGAESVASDLADAQRRADMAHSPNTPGVAADIASLPPPED